MSLPRYPRTPRQMLLVGAAILAASVFLFSLIFGLFGAAGAFATGASLLAITVSWDVTVERPNRQDRLGEAYAASVRSGGAIPPAALPGATHWTDALPGPLAVVSRNAPATLAGLLVIGVALGINGLLGGFTTSDRDDGVYVLMTSGAMAEVKGEGGADRSLRVTLLVTLDRPERANSQLTPAPWRKYWAAEVTVENTGAEDISAPAWNCMPAARSTTRCRPVHSGRTSRTASPSPPAKRGPDGLSSKSTSSRSPDGCALDYPATRASTSPPRRIAEREGSGGVGWEGR